MPRGRFTLKCSMGGEYCARLGHDSLKPQVILARQEERRGMVAVLGDPEPPSLPEGRRRIPRRPAARTAVP
jgi:hypothetical protein